MNTRDFDQLFATVASEPADGDAPPAVWPEPQMDATLRRLTEELLRFETRAPSNLGEWKQFARDAEGLFVRGARDLQLGIGLAIAWTIIDEFPGLSTGLNLLQRIVSDFCSREPESQTYWHRTEAHKGVARLLEWADRCLSQALLGVRLIRPNWNLQTEIRFQDVLEAQAFEARDPSDWPRYCRSRGRSDEPLKPWHSAKPGVSSEEFESLRLQVQEAQQALAKLSEHTMLHIESGPNLPLVKEALGQIDRLVGRTLEERAPASPPERSDFVAAFATPNPARIEELLTPISEDRPCGEYFDYDPSMLEIERALQGKPAVSLGSTWREAEPPDWEVLERKCTDFLKRCRHLRVAVILACCWLKREGFSGFLDGLTLIEGLLTKYWNEVHPILAPDDGFDRTERMNILRALTSPAGQNTHDWLRIVEYISAAPLCRPDGAPPVTFEMLAAAMARADNPTGATAPGADIRFIDPILQVSQVATTCEVARNCVRCVHRIRDRFESVGGGYSAGVGVGYDDFKLLFIDLQTELNRVIDTLEKYHSRRQMKREQAVRLLTEASAYFSSQEPDSPAGQHVKQALLMVSAESQPAPDNAPAPTTKLPHARSSRKSPKPADKKPKPVIRRRRK